MRPRQRRVVSGFQARLQHALTNGGAENGDRADEQEERRAGQPDADRRVHVEPPLGDRRHRHEGGPLPLGAGHGHLDAVGAAGHQPEVGAVERGLARHRAGGVRGRGALQSDIRPQGAHGHALDAVTAENPDRGLRETGDHTGRPHDHADAVRPGCAVEVGIRRADVRGDGDRRHGDQAARDRRQGARAPAGRGPRAAGTGAHATSGPAPSSYPTRDRRRPTLPRQRRPTPRRLPSSDGP